MSLYTETKNKKHKANGKAHSANSANSASGVSGESTSKQEWARPVPLGEQIEIPDFPVYVLPAALQTLVNELAWSMNSPADYAGVSLLVLASGAIGNSLELRITESHVQSACLFGALIGRPGTFKSPPMRKLRKAFDRMARKYFLEWQIALQAWKQKQEESKETKRGRKTQAKVENNDGV